MDKGEAERLWHERFDAVVVLPKGPLAVANYLVIRGMALLHLAWNVRVPTRERIECRRRGCRS